MTNDAPARRQLEDKVAIVTGAAGGIGAAVVREFIAQGARVLAVDREAAGLAALGNGIPGSDAALVTCTADIASAAGVAEIVAAANHAFGRIDVLVNNAGIGGPRSLRLHELDLADFDAVHAVNLRAPLALAQAVLPQMIAQGHGAIVNTVSTSAYHAVPRNGSYAISKAGMMMLTKQIAREYAGDGIRCNGVAPGVTKTPLLDGLPAPHLNAIIDAIPQQRIAQPIEIARNVAFLASDQASYVNGAVLTIDGAAST